MEISIVIPLYNEEALVEELVLRVHKVLASITPDHELMVVDDGSTDSTLQNLLSLQSKIPELVIMELSRNFGHQAAFTAGLREVKGDFVAMLDGDLEDPPEKIPDMYQLLKSGKADVVYGKRIGTGKRFNGLFHRFYRKVSGFGDLENAGHFSMMTRQALAALLQHHEIIRYLPGLRHHIGFRQVPVSYEREPRKAGKSKMSTGKLITLGSDAVFSFSKFPIRLCLYLGIIGILVFFLAGIYTLIAKLAGFAIPGWSSTLLSIYFLGSIQLTFLGILGEYVYRIYKESQKRPPFFVKKIHH